MRRLLALGVMHGALLHAGDILTLYAVCGLLLARHAHTPLRVLMRHLRVWLLLATAVYALSIWLIGAAPRQAPPDWSALYVSVPDALRYVALNADVYATRQLISLMLFLPEVMSLMLAGLVAGRMGLLTRRRWRRFASTFARRALPIGLLGNAVYAIGVVWASRTGLEGQWPWLIAALPVGWLLSAGFCAAFVSAWHAGPPRWLRALVPLGRYTLSLYVGFSLLCAVVLSGAGLRWPAGTVELALAAVLLWLVSLAAAQWAAARRLAGPLESWMSRR
jgi:uncharacterized protein